MLIRQDIINNSKRPLFLTHHNRFRIALTNVLVALTLSSCGGSGTLDSKLAEVYAKDPQKTVGQTFEIASGVQVIGVDDWRVFGWLQEHRSELRQRSTRATAAQHAALLNVGTNADNERANLLFTVVESKPIGDEQLKNQAVRIKVLNKKYAESMWWITLEQILKDGTATQGPTWNKKTAPSPVKKAKKQH